MVCLNCRTAFSAGISHQIPNLCPKCGDTYVLYDHKFKPPKKDDLKAWMLVRFLHEQGFVYQHVYKDLSLYKWEEKQNHAEYPTSMNEAEEFVVKYKSQAKKPIK